MSQGAWFPIQLSNNGPRLSHLFFVDDLVLLALASMDQVHVIKRVLEDFNICLSQKVSLAKTQVYFSPNVRSSLKNAMCKRFGFKATEDLGKYLGVPLLHSRVVKKTY